MSDKRLFLRLLAVLTCFMLVAAACGGGGGDGDGGQQGGDVDVEDIQEGGTLRFAGSGDVDYMDPASMYYTVSWFLARGVFRTLVTYPAVADFEEQNTLVPDLAEDTGTSNEDQTEWTFTIKEGVRFGPELGGKDVPGVTGEEITCDDFKYGLERVFLESVGGGYPFYYDVLVGAEDFQNGKVEEIEGIQCPDDKTIVFRLTQPTGDWPFRVAMPATSPVPREFAQKFDKEKDSNYDNHVVASGPYYVAEWKPGQLIRLERNEHWDQATDDVRQAYVDSVYWKQGFDNDVGVQKVIDGEYHLGVDVAPSGPLLERVVNDPDLSRLFINEPSLCTRYIYMNTGEEPFDDITVREAINYAIDRENLVRLRGGQVSADIATSIIPPGMGGHLPSDEYNPYETPNMAGDIEKAKELMAEAGYPNGYDEEIFVVGASDPPHDKYFESVRKDLEAIGFTNIRSKLPAFPNQYTQFYSIPARNVDIGVSAGWCKDYNDAFTFFDPLFHGDNILKSGNQNYSELDDPELNEAIDRAAATPPGPERVEAWEEVNRMATETAVWVPWSWDKEIIIYSEGLVNPIYNTFVSHVDWVVAGLTPEAQEAAGQ